MSWIQTHSGKKFYLEWPTDPETIDIEDIAEHLAKINRFVGATREPYSVAQHCVTVSQLVPGDLALEGLMHDAAEAYLGDVSRPLKRMLGEPYKLLEESVEHTIAIKYGLRWPWSEAVHVVDLRMLLTEKRDLLAPGLEWDALPRAEAYHSVKVVPWPWEKARGRFLERFHYLFKLRYRR